MSSNLEAAGNGVRLTGLVTLLALVSAMAVAGCHSQAVARFAATAAPTETSTAKTSTAETAPALTGAQSPLLGMEPVLPFDETLVTPMETVGASDKG